MWFWIFLGIAIICSLAIYYILKQQINAQQADIKRLKMENKFLKSKIKNELNIAGYDTV